MSPSVIRLLSFVALGAVLPLAGLLALLIYISIPTPTGGLEPVMATVAIFNVTFILGAMILVALNFWQQLSREAKGQHQLPH